MPKFLYNIKVLEANIQKNGSFKCLCYKKRNICSFFSGGYVLFSLNKKESERLLIYREELMKRGILNDSMHT